MSQIRHLSGRVGERLLKESGVDVFNGAQGRILYVLWEHESLTITEVGRLTSLAKTTLTGMLDRMEAGGLIVRERDLQNRRRVYVSATEKARAHRAQYDRISEKMSEIFYAGFTEAEIEDFENRLRDIIANLERENAPPVIAPRRT